MKGIYQLKMGAEHTPPGRNTAVCGCTCNLMHQSWKAGWTGQMHAPALRQTPGRHKLENWRSGCLGAAWEGAIRFARRPAPWDLSCTQCKHSLAMYIESLCVLMQGQQSAPGIWQMQTHPRRPHVSGSGPPCLHYMSRRGTHGDRKKVRLAAIPLQESHNLLPASC